MINQTLLNAFATALATVLASVAAGLAADTAKPTKVFILAGQAAAYTIVRPADASPSQIYAAEELQKFTEQMTGVKLSIVGDDGPLPERAVLLGVTRHTAALLGGPADLKALGDDGFRLKTCPPHLLILGGPVRGTLYGVYETHERFGGCRWYTTWHSIIPIAWFDGCIKCDWPGIPPTVIGTDHWGRKREVRRVPANFARAWRPGFRNRH
jgi:hypothetical protein